MNVLAVIPTRLGSERLPGKPLVTIAGRPLIEWVWRRAAAIPSLHRVVVATDSEDVAGVVRRFGGSAVLTSGDHRSGTDRVAEVASRPEFGSFEIIVNLQGDEPFLPEGAVDAAVRLVAAGGWDVGTVAAPMGSLEEWRDPSVVKVVVSRDGTALYFSRAPIPFVRGGARGGAPDEAAFASGLFLRHVGVYAFLRAALERWVSLEPSPLERFEALEQLRALWAGLRVGVAVVSGGHPGVDRPEDVARAEALLRTGGGVP